MNFNNSGFLRDVEDHRTGRTPTPPARATPGGFSDTANAQEAAVPAHHTSTPDEDHSNNGYTVPENPDSLDIFEPAPASPGTQYPILEMLKSSTFSELWEFESNRNTEINSALPDVVNTEMYTSYRERLAGVREMSEAAYRASMEGTSPPISPLSLGPPVVSLGTGVEAIPAPISPGTPPIDAPAAAPPDSTPPPTPAKGYAWNESDYGPDPDTIPVPQFWNEQRRQRNDAAPNGPVAEQQQPEAAADETTSDPTTAAEDTAPSSTPDSPPTQSWAAAFTHPDPRKIPAPKAFRGRLSQRLNLPSPSTTSESEERGAALRGFVGVLQDAAAPPPTAAAPVFPAPGSQQAPTPLIPAPVFPPAPARTPAPEGPPPSSNTVNPLDDPYPHRELAANYTKADRYLYFSAQIPQPDAAAQPVPRFFREFIAARNARNAQDAQAPPANPAPAPVPVRPANIPADPTPRLRTHLTLLFWRGRQLLDHRETAHLAAAQSARAARDAAKLDATAARLANPAVPRPADPVPDRFQDASEDEEEGGVLLADADEPLNHGWIAVARPEQTTGGQVADGAEEGYAGK